MNFTILNPASSPLSESKSDAVDGRFGGHREHSDVARDQDYTSRSGGNANTKENPYNEVTDDVDDLNDSMARKREFSRREETSNTQKNNEAAFMTQADSEHQAKMDVSDDVVGIPDNAKPKRHRKPNKFHLGTESVYEGEIR